MSCGLRAYKIKKLPERKEAIPTTQKGKLLERNGEVKKVKETDKSQACSGRGRLELGGIKEREIARIRFLECNRTTAKLTGSN